MLLGTLSHKPTLSRTINKALRKPPRNNAQIRNYMILHTTYNSQTNLPKLPSTITNLPTPPRSILLLLTPSYASLLTTPSSSLLSSHVASLLSPTTKYPIDVLAAVVDDLPGYPSNYPGGDVFNRKRNEGYSWLITDHPGLINRTFSPSPAGRPTNVDGAETFLERAQKPRNIDSQGRPINKVSGRRANWGPERPIPLIFAFPPHSEDKGKELTITLPLANTLFQTGRISTIGRISVRKDQEGKLIRLGGGENGTESGAEDAWDTVNRVYRIELPPLKSVGVQDYTYGSHIPLIKLTEPRQVVAFAGNILRELSSKSGDSNGIPASHELESAVTNFLSTPNEKKIQSGKLEIFAVITPRATAPTSSQSQGLPAPINPWIVQSGIKLRRVLSGGGGWGKKIGLLSLDPQGWTYALGDEEYSRLHYDDDNVRGDGDDEDSREFKRAFEARFFGSRDDIKDVRGEEENIEGRNSTAPPASNNASTSIVQMGDWVQFFLADRFSSPSSHKIHPSIAFGCIHKDSQPLASEPLSRDNPPGDEKTTYQMGKLQKGVDVEGLFGGRAEEGLWVHQDGEDVEGQGGKDGGLTKEEDRLGSRGGRGKMDVPGGELYVSLQGTEEPSTGLKEGIVIG